jgi:hypothetical protein
MIGNIRQDTERAVAAMHDSYERVQATLGAAQRSGEALDEITRSILQINERNLMIASATEEQALVARVYGVPIRYLGNGGLWFRSYSGSLLEKSPKSNQRALAPPLGTSPGLGVPQIKSQSKARRPSSRPDTGSRTRSEMWEGACSR